MSTAMLDLMLVPSLSKSRWRRRPRETLRKMTTRWRRFLCAKDENFLATIQSVYDASFLFDAPVAVAEDVWTIYEDFRVCLGDGGGSK